MRREQVVAAAFVMLLSSCGSTSSIVEPGPGDVEDSTTTTTREDPAEDTTDDGDVVTAETTSSTIAPVSTDGADDTDSGLGDATTATTVVIDEDSENAAAYTELAASGLVLTLDEQSCADTTAATALDDGANAVDAIAIAVQDCASPKAMDDFASVLIQAGGVGLPPTEAACVSSKLQATEEYRPFWAALLDEEPFDFLLADLDVQNRYLDLYAECVSVGRAVAEQANIVLSAPTRGCIDALYEDREFVRVTIEADLSGDVDERERIDGQLAGCLTADERDALTG